MTSKQHKKHYLFVYGTLRKGFSHSFLNDIAMDMNLVAKGEINAEFFDIGEYPAALPTKEKNAHIEGDIFEINHPRKVLKILDDYEGFDRNDKKNSEYLRKKTNIQLISGDNLEAWVYWYNFPVNPLKKITNKSYLEYLQEKPLVIH